MEVKHCCADCGEVIVVHFHNSWQEIKDCLAGMRGLCAQCNSWPECPSAQQADAGTEVEVKEHGN